MSRAELVGAVILLLADGHLALHVALPAEALSDGPLPEGTGFEFGISAVSPPPVEDVPLAGELHALVSGKLPLLESAVASSPRREYLH